MAVQGLATIGIGVKVDSKEMNYVTQIGDIGGAPSALDATCMKDGMKKNVPGVQENKNFEVTYLFDNSGEDSDYRRLKEVQAAGTIAAVEITFPDGTAFKARGYVSTYISGAKVDELISAKLVISLQSDWSVTNPAG